MFSQFSAWEAYSSACLQQDLIILVLNFQAIFCFQQVGIQPSILVQGIHFATK